MTTPIQIEIWSDIACPWCYLGKHRFEAAVHVFAGMAGTPPVEVTYRSFQLAPDLPSDFSGDHDAYLAQKFGWSAQQVAASNLQLQTLGAAYGLRYDFAANRIVNTHKAHELLHHAASRGRPVEVNERLFRAHFSDGVDIGRIEALGNIAAAAGLDRAEAVEVLETGEHAQAVEADKTQAVQLGITGVPFFVLAGRYGISGAQEPAAFLKALEQVMRERGDA